MKATYTQCGMFGTEPLYKVVYNGKTHSTPLSGRMSHHICDIINNGWKGIRRLRWSCSRNYTRETLRMVRHILA